MNDFIVSAGKLEYLGDYWSDVDSLPDGSVRLIKYKEYTVNKALEIIGPMKTYGYLADERYTIDVHLPKPRELEICIIIIRSSQNCYKAVYTDKLKSEIHSFNGLT